MALAFRVEGFKPFSVGGEVSQAYVKTGKTKVW